MKFNITIEVCESNIIEAMVDNNLNKEQVINRITNNFYMGLSCIDAMLHRDLGIDGTDSYVERT